ncbi:MAG: hypothetical protein HY720_16060 [Planctomycetes bacterium]|nr:hypothetical protein [Planctomycetota bacterium]
MAAEVTANPLGTRLFEGVSMTLGEAMKHLRLSGRWWMELVWLSRVFALPEMAKESGVAVTDDELQRAVDAYRRALNLHSSADTQAWLEQKGFTLDDVENHVEIYVLEKKLRERIPQPRIEEFFSRNRTNYRWTTLDETTRQQILDMLLEEDVETHVTKRGIKKRLIWA